MRARFVAGTLCLVSLISGSAVHAVETANTDVTVTVTDDLNPKIFAVTIPAEIPLSIDKEGTVSVADNLKVDNDSTYPVEITDLELVGGSGWTIADYTAPFSTKPAGTKEIGIKMRANNTDSAGAFSISPNSWYIGGKTSVPLYVNAKMPVQLKSTTETAATITWSFDWAPEESPLSWFNYTDTTVTGFSSEYLSLPSTPTEVFLPSKFTAIGPSAFKSNKKITRMVLPDTIATIGFEAFNECSNLEIYLPENVEIKLDARYRHCLENVKTLTYFGTSTNAPWGALAWEK